MFRRTRRMNAFVLVAVVVSASGASVRAQVILGTPTKLPVDINTSLHSESGPTISSDGLSLYYGTPIGGRGGLGIEIVVSHRESVFDPWNLPVSLGTAVNSSVANDVEPSLTSDGLTMYYASGDSQRAVYGNGDILYVTRSSKDANWSVIRNAGPGVNSSATDFGQDISADGLSLYLSRGTANLAFTNTDIYVATRASIDDVWGNAVPLTVLNNPTPSFEGSPSVSRDGKYLFFASTRDDLQSDIYVSYRPTTLDPWGSAVRLGANLNSNLAEITPDVSDDGTTLYFGRGRALTDDDSFDIWSIPILFNPSVPDINEDTLVDSRDVNPLVAEIVNQGSDPTYDLTGDGNVDLLDLKRWLSDAALTNGLVLPYYPGDANLDGFVDGLDFHLWFANRDVSGGRWTEGDFNADGAVDTLDLELWRSNRLRSSHSSSLNIPVPEPCSASLAGFITLAVCFTWRKIGWRSAGQ